MAASSSITIIGGGLAGLVLGIGLRQRGVPIKIIEAGQYPRHRVCGEFISGRGQAVLSRMGLDEMLVTAGAIPARTISFHSAARSTLPRPLLTPALCVSRHALDAALAGQFVKLGGQLHCGQRWSESGQAAGIIYATGRVPSASPNGTRWFGLKIHVRNVFLQADLEMHFSRRGYVGIARLSNHEVNVCGLLRKTAGDNWDPRDGRSLLCGPPGSPLFERLARAEFVDSSLCAVAGLSLRPKSAVELDKVCVGDAITMIPPVTGNGMSMALESAELAILPLSEWSRGMCSWTETRRKIAVACDDTFRRRLRAAQWLQRLVLVPALQNPLVGLSNRVDWFWRLAFESTR